MTPIGAGTPRWRKIAMRALDRVTLKRTVTTPFGRYRAAVSPRSHLRVLSPLGVQIDHVHAAFLVRYVKPGAVVWDIGANLGLFAFPAATQALQVFAFEPDLDMVRLLRKTKRLNPLLNVSPVACAVSDHCGTSAFMIARYGRSMNKIKGESDWHDKTFASLEERIVPTLTIDTIALPPPTIIKIDVEGADYKVLIGGEQTIAKHRPVMLIEVPEELSEKTTAFLRRHNYVILDGDSDFQEVDRSPWNTVAVPGSVG